MGESWCNHGAIIPGRSMNAKSTKSGPSNSTETTFIEIDGFVLTNFFSSSSFLCKNWSDGICGFSTAACACRSRISTSCLFVIRGPNTCRLMECLRLPDGSNSQRIDTWQDHGSVEEDSRHSMAQRVHVPASRGTLIYGICHKM
jgi:hypothetical protein